MNRGKVKNQNNNHQSESDESNNSLDLSLLRKPIKTSVEGFEEVLRAYESGTSEVSNKFDHLIITSWFINYS